MSEGLWSRVAQVRRRAGLVPRMGRGPAPVCPHCRRLIAGRLERRPCPQCPASVRAAYEGAEK